MQIAVLLLAVFCNILGVSMLALTILGMGLIVNGLLLLRRYQTSKDWNWKNTLTVLLTQ